MTLLSRDIYHQKEINEISINLNYRSKKLKALSLSRLISIFSLFKCRWKKRLIYQLQEWPH